MYIEGRKQKKYSDRLFGELCLFYLLMSDGEIAPLHILRSRLNVSDRTLYRYAKDLRDCGLCPKLFKSTKKGEEYEYEYFSCGGERPSEHAAPSGNRLYRCGMLLYRNYEAVCFMKDIYDDPEDLEPYEKLYTYNGTEFVLHIYDDCDDLYEGISLRTKQRDLTLVREVLFTMYDS